MGEAEKDFESNKKVVWRFAGSNCRMLFCDTGSDFVLAYFCTAAAVLLLQSNLSDFEWSTGMSGAFADGNDWFPIA